MTSTLVSKAAEVGTSTAAHIFRTAILLAILERLDERDLPTIREWSSKSSDYKVQPSAPGVRGYLEFAYGYDLDKARAAVQAWADALGTTMTERYVEQYSREVQLEAALEVDGVWIRIGVDVSVNSRCPGCGGPAVGSHVLRHFTDAPCAGALALQA